MNNRRSSHILNEETAGYMLHLRFPGRYTLPVKVAAVYPEEKGMTPSELPNATKTNRSGKRVVHSMKAIGLSGIAVLRECLKNKGGSPLIYNRRYQASSNSIPCQDM